jgi:AcrR family transcriptional regulator
MARRVGIGKDSVARIWPEYGLGPRGYDVAAIYGHDAQSDSEEPLLSKGTLKDARWLAILNVAEEVLSEKGYQESTIQEIASRVGLLKGSLYYYIENKEDLLYQVVHRANVRYLQVLQEDPRISRGDPVARLTHFIDRHMIQLDRDRSWNRHDERDHIFVSAERLGSINAIRYQTQLLLKSILTDGVAEGIFDPNLDPSVAANSIISLMNTTLRWYRPGGRCSIQEIGEWYKSFTLKGLILTERVGSAVTSTRRVAG